MHPLVLKTFAAPVELRTPRVLLRQWKDSDSDAWAAMNADPAVRRYFPTVLSRADAQAEAERIRAAAMAPTHSTVLAASPFRIWIVCYSIGSASNQACNFSPYSGLLAR